MDTVHGMGVRVLYSRSTNLCTVKVQPYSLIPDVTLSCGCASDGSWRGECDVDPVTCVLFTLTFARLTATRIVSIQDRTDNLLPHLTLRALDCLDWESWRQGKKINRRAVWRLLRTTRRRDDARRLDNNTLMWARSDGMRNGDEDMLNSARVVLTMI